MRKNLKLISADDGSANKKYKRGYGGAYGVAWWSLRLAGVFIQSVGFVLMHLA
jgi:hypothetical protein